MLTGTKIVILMGGLVTAELLAHLPLDAGSQERVSHAHAGSQYWRVVDRLSLLPRLRLSETYRFVVGADVGHLDLRFVAPNRLTVGGGLQGVPGSGYVRVRRVSRSQLRRIVGGWILVQANSPRIPNTSEHVLHQLKFSDRTVSRRIGGKVIRLQMITIQARGYPWLCAGIHSCNAITESEAEQRGRYVAVLVVNSATGLPLSFDSTVYWLGRSLPAQRATFTYGRL